MKIRNLKTLLANKPLNHILISKFLFNINDVKNILSYSMDFIRLVRLLKELCVYLISLLRVI